jgi:excinuclease ABC subunit C
MWSRPPEIIDLNRDPDGAVAAAPERPAVFLVHASAGAPYLARTVQLRRRLRRLLAERTGVSRALNLREVASRVEYWLTGSRLESSLALYWLARRHFPEVYPRLVKLRMPYYLRLILSNPYPRTQVTARLSGGRSFYYGPFRSRAAAEQFESGVLDLFQLRRCQEDLAPSTGHPGCIYGEMNMCLRPCQLRVSAEEYRSEAERVLAFLETGGRSLAEPVEAARDRLSEELDFEAAAREHKRLETVERVLRDRDELACAVAGMTGVGVTPSAHPGAVELWFMLEGRWIEPVHLGFEVVEGKAVSLDHRLREIAAGLRLPEAAGARERQEHIALLARWYYSSWRDGEWLPFRSPAELPYRRLVKAVSRALSPGS